MKLSQLLILIFIVTAAFVVYYSIRGSESPEEYAKQIEADRKQKDLFMKTGEDSPLRGITDFKGLKYFPPDLKYRVYANLIPIEDKKMILLPTSDGKQSRYLEHAFAEFELDGITNRLLILEVTDPGPHRGTLYLAFADKTSAAETYGAGRYLDIKKIPGAASVELDFNKAYNPYCAYADNFSCPFPPPGNTLKVAIRAGEMGYH
jgi:hypothetical protein